MLAWYNRGMNKNGQSLILLTYKGKILLMHRDSSPLVQSAWGFIEGEKEKNKSFEESIFEKVEKELNIKLTNAAFLSDSRLDNVHKCFYHADLTDKDVNNITRDEGQTLEFFSFHEVEKLSLTESSKKFLIKHRDFLEKVLSN